MKIADFNYYTYNKDNVYHKDLIDSLLRDKKISSQLPSIRKFLREQKQDDSFWNKSYVVEHNDELIGFAYVFEPNDYNVNLYYAVNPTFWGYNYGKNILINLSSYILERYQEVKFIELVIKQTNNYSINSAREAGFIAQSSIHYTKSRSI